MAEILLGRLVGPFGFEKPVVIKRILSHMADDPGFVAMFRDEAQILASLRHPNVVQVFEFGIDDDGMFLVMEYLEGETVGGLLRRLYGQGSNLDPAAAASIAAAACAGLHAAHEQTDAQGRPRQLVHRDIAPDNIFVTYDGEVKLLDFGVAKAEGRVARTETGGVKGTRPYMSPEQCLAKPIDRRSDIFSLGVVFFEMCTMRRLFQRENPLLALRAICVDPIPSLAETVKAIPRELDSIARKALERRPEDRYPTAQEMRRDLLSAARKLSPREPEELLASLMSQHFSDRKKEKSDLKHGLVQGLALTRIPEAAVDLETTMPPVGLHGHSSEKTLAGSAGPRQPRPFTAAAAIIAVGVTSVAALWGWLRPLPVNRGEPAPSAANELAPQPEVRSASAKSAPTSEASASPSRSESRSSPSRLVTIEVVTKPEGARVLAAGDERGKTPARLQLPAGETVVPLEVLRDGFIPYRLGVRPNVDQKYVLTLERHRPASPRVAEEHAIAAPPATPSPSRDEATASSASLSAAPGPTPVPPASSPSGTAGPRFRRFDEPPSSSEGQP